MRGKTAEARSVQVLHGGFNEGPRTNAGENKMAAKMLAKQMMASMRPPHECGGKLVCRGKRIINQGRLQ